MGESRIASRAMGAVKGFATRIRAFARNRCPFCSGVMTSIGHAGSTAVHDHSECHPALDFDGMPWGWWTTLSWTVGELLGREGVYKAEADAFPTEPDSDCIEGPR